MFWSRLVPHIVECLPNNECPYSQNNQTFGILRVEPQDRGEYMCEVENKAGKLIEKFTVEVLGEFAQHVHHSLF